MKKLFKLLKQKLEKEIQEETDEFKNIKIDGLKKHNNFSWIIILFTFIFYEIQFYCWPKAIPNFFINVLHLNVYLYFFILDIITILLAIYALKNELKESFNNFKNQIFHYLKYLLYTGTLFVFINAFVSIICNLIVGEIPDNQSGLETYNIFYLAFGSIIYAPIVEEIIYRGIIRKFIKNDKLFILSSGLLFGLAHVVGSSSLIQYIYILDYGLSGAFLAFLYTKHNNIYLNMSAHFIINFIACFSMILKLL